MANTENRVVVLIGSGQFFCRLGIKTMLSVIGIEPEIVEINSFEKLVAILKSGSGINYILLSSDILPTPAEKSLESIKSLANTIPLMLVGSEQEMNKPGLKSLNSDNQKEVLERLQDFFAEPNDGRENPTGDMLSDREIEVLKTIALGYSNKEAADKLFISINTVITHRKNITDKLGIKTIAGLTVYAIMKKIINPGDVRL